MGVVLVGSRPSGGAILEGSRPGGELFSWRVIKVGVLQ